MTACRSRVFASLFLMALTLSALHGDVTLRYKTEIKIDPTLPAQMAAGARRGWDSAMAQDIVLRFKGGKAFAAVRGFNWITDLATKDVTILDAAGKRYAKAPHDRSADEAARAAPEMLAAIRAAMASAGLDVSPARVTGRTGVIQGVEAEEREVVISVEEPATPNAPAGPAARIVMQFWTAKPGEVLRVPAIRELTGYSLVYYATMNPAASVLEMMKQWPGLGNAFDSAMKEVRNGIPILRAHIDVFLPAVAVALERMPAGSNPLGAGFDPNAPFVQANEEAVEISSEPLPDSFFQVPEDYQEAPAAELMKGSPSTAR